MPRRHQVWELPEITPTVTEYQRHRLGCPVVAKRRVRRFRRAFPRDNRPPRLVAFAGLLMGHFRQSKRRAASFLQDFAVFAIFPSRKAEALPKLLGTTFHGIINCDRAKMYWRAKRLQWCWSHLQRAIQWQTFRTYMRPIREEVNALLLRGAFSGNPRLVGMCNELHDHRQWLWTFVDHEGIEPANHRPRSYPGRERLPFRLPSGNRNSVPAPSRWRRRGAA